MATPAQPVRLRFEITSPNETQFFQGMKAALVHNCISGIRNGVFCGAIGPKLPEKEPETTLFPLLTVDVLTSFSQFKTQAQQDAHVAKIGQEVQTEWAKLAANFDKSPRLQIKGVSREAMGNSKVFDDYRWKKLLLEFANQYKIPDPQGFSQHGLLSFKGTDLQLFYTEQEPEMFELRIDVGAVPKDVLEAHLHLTLLMHNSEEGLESGMWWCVNPKNAHLVLVVKHPLSASDKTFSPPTPHDMAMLLEHSATESARFWSQLKMETHRIQKLLNDTPRQQGPVHPAFRK